MDGVTLVESGASRAHFAFLKKLEACKDAVRADELIVATVEEVKGALQSKSIFSTSSSPASQLVLLLHCLQLFPCSSPPVSARPTIQFALVPALELAATAERCRDLYIAYSVLQSVFADQDEEEQHQTSLLLLNTIRQHLEGGVIKGEKSSPRASSTSRRGGRESNIRSSSPKVTMALRSIISGIPTGSDIFPALYSPISKLCLHSDPSIQSLALDALHKIYSYVDQDRGLAKALWEQTKRVSKTRRDGSNSGCTSLPKAILRGTVQALREGVISNGQAFDAALELARQYEDSSDVIIAALSVCVDIVSTAHPPQAEQIEAVRTTAAKELLNRADDYSSLLSFSLMLGRLAEVERPSSRSEELVQVWTVLKSHLYAKNANRKVLAIKALKALLPFAWYQSGNDAGLDLGEGDMARIMDLLGDIDDNVRIETLTLVQLIDSTLLDAHLEQLVAASSSEAHTPSQRKEYTRRGVEVMGLQLVHRNDAQSFTKYAADTTRILKNASQSREVDDRAISLILGQLRKIDPASRCRLLTAMLDAAGSDMNASAPSIVLLCASAACETDCRGEQAAEILSSLSNLISAVSSPALVEALLIGMIKVASSLDGPIGPSVVQKIGKMGESTASSLAKHRVEQLKQVMHGPSRLKDLPNASLLETMDRIDRIAAQDNKSSSAAGARHSSAAATAPLSSRSPRPLQYEAYAEQAAASPPPASYSTKKPFTALPEPSQEVDDRARRHRLKQEKSVQDNMHKSIARLTLGVEESDEDEDDTST